MKNTLAATALLTLAACGGGGGGSDTLAPAPAPTPTPTPTTNEPTPSALFTDISATLPDARNGDCFDAHAFDAEGDGDLDIVIAAFSQTGAANRLFVNDGTGTFTDASSTAFPANAGISEHVATGDFDMDGDIDIVFANVNSSAGDTHELYFNTGSGPVFEAAATPLPVNGLSAFVAARDFDTDNDLDLFFSNFGASDLLINDGTGAFTEESDTRLPGGENQITEDSGIGDVNGDGFDDIFVAYRGSSGEGVGLQNRLWLNDGLGVFTDVTDTNLPPLLDSTFDVQLADLDNDGDLDAVVVNATIGATNQPLADTLLINDGNGVFTDETATRWPQAVVANTYGVTIVDLDRDGDPDLLTAENRGAVASGTVRAYGNDGTGTFSEQTGQLIGTVEGNMVDLEVADFNGDGLLDIYFCATRNFGTEESGRDFLFLGQ